MNDCEPLYSVRTWDSGRGEFTPETAIAKSHGLTLAELRAAIRELRDLGYTAHRRGNCEAGHADNDAAVLIERENLGV